MKRIVLALVLFAACSACTGPVPEGFTLPNQGPAIAQVARYFGVTVPNVSFVDADTPHPSEGVLMARDPGTGRLYMGLSLGDDVWIALHPSWTLYSQTSLAHEAAHRKHGDHDHTRPEIWGPGGYVEACKAWLAAQPEIDVIEFGEVQ